MESEILAEIRRIASQELEISHPIQPGDQLIQDLELDSLGATVLAVGLEDKFRIRLTPEDSGQVETVEDLVQLVARRTRGVAQ
jgi:acyl carrier protein